MVPWASSHRLVIDGHLTDAVASLLWSHKNGQVLCSTAQGFQLSWADSTCKARTIGGLPTEVALIRQGLDG